jgi:hypothetical protein
MVGFTGWLPGLVALLISVFGSFVLLLVTTEPDGEFGVLGVLPIMLVGLVLGFLQRRQWAGLIAIMLPIAVFVFLWIHGPFCHWDG